jgi:N-acetylmuramoyl-L-alanine amidase
MKKIALIVGHNIQGKNQGAINYLGESESSFNLRISKKIIEKLEGYKCAVAIFTRDGLSIGTVGREVAHFNPSLSIELHFNSFPEPTFGCEVLAIENDLNSYEFAQLIASYVSEVMGIKRRRDQGLFIVSQGGRGYNNLSSIEVNQVSPFPKVLVEPCFANIKTEESQFFFENEDKYAQLLADAIVVQAKLIKKIKKIPRVVKKEISPKKSIIDKIITFIKNLLQG